MANCVIFFFATWCALVSATKADQQVNCTASRTCGECIQSFGCVWCADPDVGSERCQDEEGTKCSKQFLINPKASYTTDNSMPVSKQEKPPETPKKANKNKSKNPTSSVPTLKHITVSPQLINVTMRPNSGHPLRIKMRYHHTQDYPLDIYYLMDTSKSLLKEQMTLSLGSLGIELKKKVSKITSDLRLGFGSFVEKPVEPFIRLGNEKNSTSCDKCIPAYSFRNYLPLTKNMDDFTKVIRASKLSVNEDKPESVLDAVMQAVVCHEEIRWRNKARKLLVCSTDAAFHIAGDGKLLGIQKPNDGCCHLDKDGYYTESTNHDYPSISHIRSKVEENSINLIFTVPRDQTDLYKKLTNIVDGVFIAEQKPEASYKDVMRIITEQYEKITSEVEIEGSNLPEQLRLQYYSKCLNSTGALLKTNKCEGLKINDSVEFEIEIELIACPIDSSQWNQQFYIKPHKVNESMTVNLKMLCDCECDKKDTILCEQKSPKCSKHGTLKFGFCQCDTGYSGVDCSCPYKEYNVNVSNCREKPGAALCSDRGSCKCNKCYCESRTAIEVGFFGEFCQCSNFTCPYNQGNICSGNGVCNCNKCYCNKGWSDEDCSCEQEQTNCLSNSNGEVCSGHGTCVCNKCVCDQTKGYSGRLCDKCLACPTLCSELEDCVLCQSQRNKQCANVCKGKTSMVNDLEDISHEGNTKCEVFDSEKCKYMFAYKVNGKEIELKVLQYPICDSGQASVWKFVIGLISAIVLIGFSFLMVWKMFVIVQDRKEFSKFEEERAKSMWKDSQNPLYVPASTRYRNPMFEDKSDWDYKQTKRD